MKNLENQILKKVYGFEIRKTFLQIISQIVGVIIFVFIGYLFLSVFFDEVLYLNTFDPLVNLTEDFEIAKKSFFDTVSVIYMETPKETLVVGIISVLVVFFLIFTFIKNFPVVKNKFSSLLKFWRKKI